MTALLEVRLLIAVSNQALSVHVHLPRDDDGSGELKAERGVVERQATSTSRTLRAPEEEILGASYRGGDQAGWRVHRLALVPRALRSRSPVPASPRR